ncbi:hypothetical protein SO802_007733 [Lithocarpus litseifolius]|uniref:Uncharacterized protein n=1 Tax=Lithocarpus litseifolius TaxID=425828 RepID=A0AAW2DTN6_9ROSI
MQAKANRAPIERADMYLKVYCRRDGAAITPHAQENMHPGRVREVGFGITPSGRNATNTSQFTSTPSASTKTTQRISELENNGAILREQLAQVQEQLSQLEARHQEQLSQVKARHQQQMAEVMTHMNAMIAQLSQGVRDLDTS